MWMDCLYEGEAGLCGGVYVMPMSRAYVGFQTTPNTDGGDGKGLSAAQTEKTNLRLYFIISFSVVI